METILLIGCSRTNLAQRVVILACGIATGGAAQDRVVTGRADLAARPQRAACGGIVGFSVGLRTGIAGLDTLAARVMRIEGAAGIDIRDLDRSGIHARARALPVARDFRASADKALSILVHDVNAGRGADAGY